MRTTISFLLIVFLSGSYLTGQTSGNTVVDAILAGYSAQNYTTVPVTDQQIDLILKCGIRAPSANNKQPWKFTVIKDESTVKGLIEKAVPGNIIIVVSGLVGQDGKTTPDFDCGLAAQSMTIGAEALGLGVRMYGSSARRLNLNKEAYQIPAGYNAVIVLRIGNIEKGVDAVSAASARKAPEEVINYFK